VRLDASKKLKNINPLGRYDFQSITVLSVPLFFPYDFISRFAVTVDCQIRHIEILAPRGREVNARDSRCVARISDFRTRRINVPNIPVRIDAQDSGSINNQSATIMPDESVERRVKNSRIAGQW